MCKLYNILKDLCDEKGITGYRMCKDIGIQPSIMTDLKMGRRVGVNAETASKIANYFNVSVDYLLGKEKEKATMISLFEGVGGRLSEAPDITLDDELNEYLEELKNREELRMLFSLTKGATKEEVERAVRILEAALGK